MIDPEIDVTNVAYCPESNCVSGLVSLTMEDRVLTMHCRCEVPTAYSSDVYQQGLILDAIRQLRRMPEFQSGEADAIDPETLNWPTMPTPAQPAALPFDRHAA